jgi:conjugal transfer ATP-binding protein TraC
MFFSKQPRNLAWNLEGYMEERMNQPRLHHLLPYESFDPETQLFYNNDATGFALIANPIVGANLEDQQQMAEFFRQNGYLSEGTSLQFLLFASPYIGEQLDFWTASRAADASEAGSPVPDSPETDVSGTGLPKTGSLGKNVSVFQRLAERRGEFLKNKAFEDEEGYLIRDYRLLISYAVPGHKDNPVDQNALMMFRKELRAVLETLGVYSTSLDAQGLIREVGGILNISKNVYPYVGQWEEHDSISKQMVDSHRTFRMTESDLFLNDGQTVCRSYVPKVSPKRWSLGNMDRMIGSVLKAQQKIGCPYLIHYGFFVDSNQSRAKAKAYAKRTSLEKSLKGGMAKFVPGLSEKYEESIEIAEELQKGGQVIVSSLSYTVFSPPQDIQENEQQLRRIWGSGGWNFQPARYDHLFMLLSSLPMTWTLGFQRKGLFKKAFGAATGLEQLSKAKKTVTKEAQNLLPLCAEWKGQNAPGMPLVGRRGQLFFWNPFSHALLPKAPNAQTDHSYNVCVAGQSGSGKSVFLNDLMSTVMGVGGKVFVLDFGRSFKKACHILAGRHIEFDVRSPISLNPFTHIPEGNTQKEIEDRSDMLALTCPIFQVMAAPKEGTSDLENAFLEQAIRWSWENYLSNSSVDTVREFLINHKDLIANHIGETLSSFGTKGAYGHFFNKPANSDLKENLIVIETDNLRSYPSLLAVVVQMLILQVNQEMAKGNRAQPFLIIIDEAWKLLGGKDTAAFISEATRTARKYKGSIVCATQHLTDYFKPESPGATEAFNCSSWKCILYQENDVITSLKNHPQLQGFVDNEYKEALLRSVHSNPPHYSEIAIFGPGISGIIGGLRLDPFSRLLYSTNPQEYQAIENLIHQGASIEEAIDQIIHQTRPGEANLGQTSPEQTRLGQARLKGES